MDPDRLMEEMARLRERGLVEHLPLVGEEPSDPWEAAALTRRRAQGASLVAPRREKALTDGSSQATADISFAADENFDGIISGAL